MKRLVVALLLLVFLLLLSACASKEAPTVKVIVGAKLIASPGATPIEFSVIVIEGGKFREVGPQSSTPVPKGAEITSGLGKTASPVDSANPIEPGQPANLVLNGTESRTLRNGEWIR